MRKISLSVEQIVLTVGIAVIAAVLVACTPGKSELYVAPRFEPGELPEKARQAFSEMAQKAKVTPYKIVSSGKSKNPDVKGERWCVIFEPPVMPPNIKGADSTRYAFVSKVNNPDTWEAVLVLNEPTFAFTCGR